MAAKYKEIVLDLERELAEGKYNETRKLPREEDLIEKYGVSRSTVRKAISVLVTKGYVYQVQGSGIFLRDTFGSDYISLEQLRGLTRDFPNSEVTGKVRKLELVPASEELAAKLKITPGDPVYYVVRSRYINGHAYTLEYSYYPQSIIPYLNEEILLGSLYSYVIENLKLTIGFADKIIYAEKLEAETAELLELDEGDPGIAVDSVVYLSSGKIFEVSTSVHNYKYAKFLKTVSF